MFFKRKPNCWIQRFISWGEALDMLTKMHGTGILASGRVKDILITPLNDGWEIDIHLLEDNHER